MAGSWVNFRAFGCGAGRPGPNITLKSLRPFQDLQPLAALSDITGARAAQPTVPDQLPGTHTTYTRGEAEQPVRSKEAKKKAHFGHR